MTLPEVKFPKGAALPQVNKEQVHTGGGQEAASDQWSPKTLFIQDPLISLEISQFVLKSSSLILMSKYVDALLLINCLEQTLSSHP